MRTLLILCTLASASTAYADEDDRDQHLESQTDIGGVIGISPKLGHRIMTRTLFNVDDRENAFEAHYGLAWKPRRGFTYDVTAGYAVGDDGPTTRHGFVLGLWKGMSFFDRALRVQMEQFHRFGDGYRYQGFYAVDYMVAGVHASNIGREASAGFHFGSGHGLLPFRFDIRISFGVTDGAPEHASRFVMTLDFR